jgi:hypothetical protein
MTSNKNTKLAAREYAKAHSVPYTQALRAVTGPAPTNAFPAWPMVPTQMTQLDELLGGGLPRGEVTALWAPTGTGTSMFGITLARMTARAAKDAVIVMAESGSELYVRRLIAATTGVPTSEFDASAGVPDSWPPAWGSYLHLYEPERLPSDPVQTADELRVDAHNAGRAPVLIVVDDLRSFQVHSPDAPVVFAELARDLRAAVVVIDALPNFLCRVEPSLPDEMDDITTLGWPHRVPSNDELLDEEQTRVLAETASTSLIMTTPGDPPIEGEVTVLDLTARSSRGPGGVMQVRRDGPRSRILPGAGS